MTVTNVIPLSLCWSMKPHSWHLSVTRGPTKWGPESKKPNNKCSSALLYGQMCPQQCSVNQVLVPHPFHFAGRGHVSVRCSDHASPPPSGPSLASTSGPSYSAISQQALPNSTVQTSPCSAVLPSFISPSSQIQTPYMPQVEQPPALYSTHILLPHGTPCSGKQEASSWCKLHTILCWCILYCISSRCPRKGLLLLFPVVEHCRYNSSTI